MTYMTMDQPQNNPFTPDSPARTESGFVGREDIFRDIRGALGSAPVERPLVVCGPSRIGKTSLLLRLVDGALDEDAVVLYTDFEALDTSSFSGFLWHLAKSIMAGMEQQEFESPTIEKRMLVLNPQLVFRQRFWQPLLMKAHINPLLLAWDNFDTLSTSILGSPKLQSLRAYLYGLLETDAPVDLILAVTGRVEAIGENALSPFRLESSLRLTNLNREQTIRIIQRPGAMTVFGPVADFMFSLTAGHPGDTQRLSHTLYEHQLTHHHGQVTIADVVSILQEELSPSDFVGNVYQRLRKSVAITG